MIKNPNPLHPGVVLEEIYMKDLSLNQSELARKLRCSHRKINEIVNGKRAISAEFALALEDALGISAAMWVRMQADYDLAVARKKMAA